MIQVRQRKINRIQQGDLIKNVDCVERYIEKDGILQISKIRFPLIVVLTQECDLRSESLLRSKESDDKWLVSILVAPVYNSQHVVRGEHLKRLEMKSQVFNEKSSKWKFIKQNEIPRYHYIDFPSSLQLSPGIVDFKHYFSTNISYLEECKSIDFVCGISSSFKEDLSTRFSNFLSRIGLPEIKSK